MDWISLTGSVASIGGAAISIFSAIKANSIKNMIIGKWHSDIISELKMLGKVTLSQINKICKPEEKLRGINLSEIVDSAQKFYESLSEHKDILSRCKFSGLEKLLTDLGSEIKSLKYQNNKLEIRNSGDVLYDLTLKTIQKLSTISNTKLKE